MSTGLSLETVKALTGRTIVRVGETGLHLDNGKAIYLSEDEIESLNDYHAPDEDVVVKKPIRYSVYFFSRQPKAKVWVHEATEQFNEKKDALARFDKSILLCHNSVESVHIKVVDELRIGNDLPNEVIVEYRKVVE